MKFDQVDFSNPNPLPTQITKIIEQKIVKGEIQVGKKLPTQRELRKSFNVSINAVGEAISNLINKGYLSARSTRGTFVISSKSRSIDFKSKNKIGLLNFIADKEYSLSESEYLDSYDHKILKGIEGQVKEKGIYLIYKNISENKVDLGDIENEIAGLIIMGDVSPECLREVKRAGFPFVLMGDVKKKELTNGGVDIVTSDDFQKVYLAARHLIDAGHKRIVYISRSLFSWDLEKNRAYMQALKESDIPCDRNLTPQVVDFSMEEGYDTIKSLLKRQIPFTGLVSVGSSNLLNGIMKALEEKNLKIPQDVSIVACHKTIPGITSIYYEVEELGKTAVELLIEKLESATDWNPRRAVVSSKFTAGDSVRQIRRVSK